MNEQTFFLSLAIGIIGASASLGLALGAKEMGQLTPTLEITPSNGGIMVRASLWRQP